MIKKKTLGVVASIGAGVLIIIIMLIKFPLSEIFSTFTNFNLVLLLQYLGVSMLLMMAFAWRWQAVISSTGHKVGFFHLLSYRLMGYGISYITPSAKLGGEPVRAAMLKKHGIDFKEGLSTVMIDKTMELSWSAIFFVFGAFFAILEYALPGKFIGILVGVSIIFVFLIWKFYSRLFRGKPVFSALFNLFRIHKIKKFAKYETAIRKFEQPIIDFHKTQKKEFFIVNSITILTLILSLIEYKLLLLMIGVHASLFVTFLVFSIVGLSFLIPVPMALGSLEAAQAGMFALFGLGTAAAGLGVAMVTRFRDFIWVFTAGVLLIFSGSFGKYVKKAYDDKPVISVGIDRNGKKKSLDIKVRSYDNKK